ncbi:transglycosylase family protein [Glutamicibacter sp. AOP5-A2-18]|uniref:transglycosylase family protein n=1 Tax=Glutamicibacter sp. AOP5-A2-18 TaxID=3457656 RepID=UPI004033225E
MIQQKTKKLIRRGGASLAAVAVAGGAIVATTAPANAAGAGTWDKLAQCESGGNWSINTGNGYYGGLQFTLQTWKAFGGSGMPNNASKAEQIRVATKVQAAQGWGAWPACTAKLGISGSAPSAPSTSTETKSTTSTETKKSYAAPKKSTTSTETKKSYEAPKKTYVAPKVAETKQAAPSTSGKHAAPVAKAPSFNIDVTDSGKNYTIKSGDTLNKIANQLGVSDWRGLFVLNDDQLTDPNVILVGQTLNVPAN